MSDCMTQEDAERMDNRQAVEILKPLRDMMRDQHGCPISDAFFALNKAIEALSAQPERKTGRWIYGEKDCQDGWYCSECNFFIPWDYDYYGLNNIDFIRDYHTCPHCDAKMLTYTGAKMEVEHV